MFGIGIGEFILIAVVALLVLGPEKLPVTLRAVGRALREFRRATNELRSQIDLQEPIREIRRQIEGVDSPKPKRPALADTKRIYPPEGPDLEDVLPEGSPYPPVAPVAPEEDGPSSGGEGGVA